MRANNDELCVLARYTNRVPTWTLRGKGVTLWMHDALLDQIIIVSTRHVVLNTMRRRRRRDRQDTMRMRLFAMWGDERAVISRPAELCVGMQCTQSGLNARHNRERIGTPR